MDLLVSLTLTREAIKMQIARLNRLTSGRNIGAFAALERRHLGQALAQIEFDIQELTDATRTKGHQRPDDVKDDVMAIAVLTVRKVETETYVIEMADDLGSIAVHVPSPKPRGGHAHSEAERERLARSIAQELASRFAEALLDEGRKPRN